MLSDAYPSFPGVRARAFFVRAHVVIMKQLPAAGRFAAICALADVMRVTVSEYCDLRSTVTERSPYTVRLDLTYCSTRRPHHLPGHGAFASITTPAWSKPRNGRRNTSTKPCRRLRVMAER